MRNLLVRLSDELRFVYNFHAYGNMYIEPVNAIDIDLSEMLFKQIKEVFDEITTDAVMPEAIKIGPAPQTIEYLASGEASDWIVTALGIPAVSPELGSKDPATNAFKLDSWDIVYGILTDSYSYVNETFKKLGDQTGLTGIQYFDKKELFKTES
eukprot:CAMPEP_0176356800 /NCGR_PEP_ID=MMETSP0126-20121128/14278_1 /TAXON_ID=141414 ORGANISM="Strombidinopsis acuminatum, Strain SPMC142" /NCGR_SAMPLE_ID=MMETSP0126 /ASSEMBLY_ACC=CAM_ASM_000229 /LENGTH=153 /DNA_ID=CAMNT_0017710055 /DNA_START=383 /DNA_END=844 /DNA_ORIENTATION=+